MKNLSTYIIENNKQEEIIDEGLKDWIKKCAVTAALATAIIGGANAQNIQDVQKYTDDNGNKIEQVSSDEIKQLDSNEIQTLRSQRSKNDQMAYNLLQAAIKQLKEKHPNISILKYKKLQSKSTGFICYEILYTIN